MILSFKTKINDKPTYFIEKILKVFDETECLDADKEMLNELMLNGYLDPFKYDDVAPKIHTIRKDEHDRWEKDMMIDFFINPRQKDMFRFAPRIPVISTQKIKIIYSEFKINGKGALLPAVWIDDVLHYDYVGVMTGNMMKIAQNDGFESVVDFFQYFNEDFEGKIIHWTDLKY